ncbi:MAG: hypothetical protein DRN12_04570, partial [Thermoplasmata archaeon]
ITHRFREEMNRGLIKRDAMKLAIERTGLSLVEAASTTVAGIASIFFMNISALQEFALLIILMTISSLIGAVFILPIFYDFKFIK